MKEYIISLKKTRKWFRDQINSEFGDFVLLHQNNIARSHWSLG